MKKYSSLLFAIMLLGGPAVSSASEVINNVESNQIEVTENVSEQQALEIEQTEQALETEQTEQALETEQTEQALETEQTEQALETEQTEEALETEQTESSEDNAKEVKGEKAEESIDAWMPDKTLQQLVATALGVTVEEITKEMVNNHTLNTSGSSELTYIIIDGNQVADLTGLEQVGGFVIVIKNTVPKGFNGFDDNVKDKPSISFINTGLDYYRPANVTNVQFVQGVEAEPLRVNISSWDEKVHVEYKKEGISQPIISKNAVNANVSGRMADFAVGSVLGNVDPNSALSEEDQYLLASLMDVEESSEIIRNEADFTNIKIGDTNFMYIAGGNYSTVGDAEMNYINMPLIWENTLVVEYQDEEGNILETAEVTAELNTDYTTEQKDIPGYEFVKSTDNASGTMTEATDKIIYTYKKTVEQTPIDPEAIGKAITVNYVDSEGNEIKESTLVTGEKDKKVTIETPEIEGYVYDSADKDLNMVISNEGQTITLTYKKSEEQTPIDPEAIGKAITVNYVDSEGNEIKESTLVTGEKGKEVTIETPEIEGYVYDSADKDLNMVISNEGQTITLTYKKSEEQTPIDPEAIGKAITVNYVDSEGNEIKESTTVTGEKGKEVTIETPEIEGYVYDSADKDLNMVISNEGQTITLTYKKSTEWTELEPSKPVEETESTEWTELEPSKPVEETESTEWTELEPSKPVEETESTEWTELTPAKPNDNGNTPGGNTPGGNTPGGNTPGGNRPGVSKPGGNTSGLNRPGSKPSINSGSGSSVTNKRPSGTLPQTGEKVNSAFSLAGATLMMLSVVAYVLRKRN